MDFVTPEVEEVHKLGITSFVFSTQWFNGFFTPLMPAAQMQQAFSRANNVTLLAYVVLAPARPTPRQGAPASKESSLTTQWCTGLAMAGHGAQAAVASTKAEPSSTTPSMQACRT